MATKKKTVGISPEDEFEEPEEQIRDPSYMRSLRQSRMSFVDKYNETMYRAIQGRARHKIIFYVDGEKIEMSPKTVPIESFLRQFRCLSERVNEFPLLNPGPTGRLASLVGSRASVARQRMSVVGLKCNMDEIITGIGDITADTKTRPSISAAGDETDETAEQHSPKKHIYARVTLTLSSTFVLFEQPNLAATKGTGEGDYIEADNQLYEYLTVGKGKVRRRSEAEAQTIDTLRKSRTVNTDPMRTSEKDAYVSYFEMYDTVQEVLRKEASLGEEPVEGQKPVEKVVDTRTPTLEDQSERIVRLPQFRLAQMIMERCIAGNVYAASQRRFRNMPNADPQPTEYKYRLQLLFKFPSILSNRKHMAVTDISFCPANGDIVAVAYGIFSHFGKLLASCGIVLVWSIKNPDTPERKYFYAQPVSAVQFSPYLSNLLAIGMYDGRVEVLDITHADDAPIAISMHSIASGIEPVMSIRWVKQAAASSTEVEIDPFISLSQNGTVTKFRVINSPYLFNTKQLALERVEGQPEGLNLRMPATSLLYAGNPHPQGMNLTIHPAYNDIYYVTTDEGCVHKCSTNYTLQYLQVWRMHASAVNNMDFSPWSPKLFLTCGNDWTIRIWLEDIHKPLITLQSGLSPVHCAYWSRTHATVIISVNRKSVDIWDIQRNVLKPMSSTNFDITYLTTAQFSMCGNSLAVGNENGLVLMYAFEDMPTPFNMQYDQLVLAILKAIECSVDLTIELKAYGYFGYPNGGRM